MSVIFSSKPKKAGEKSPAKSSDEQPKKTRRSKKDE